MFMLSKLSYPRLSTRKKTIWTVMRFGRARATLTTPSLTPYLQVTQNRSKNDLFDFFEFITGVYRALLNHRSQFW